MMRITVNKDAQGVVKYFTQSLTRDDYFFTGKNSIGYFYGKLVDNLGLPNQVTKKAFSHLVHNRHPVSGEKLTPRDVEGRIASIEYTFSAPKSVSVLMAMSNEKVRREILNAHRYAVRKAMEEIEQSMTVKVWKDGRQGMGQTEGICYAHFVHFTSRPTRENDTPYAKYSSDPNLHSHAVVPNIGKFNGRYLALASGTVHYSASYMEQVYHAHLSRRLVGRNFAIQRTKDRWEIISSGMTKRTLDKYSRRTQEIEALAKKLGITNAKIKSGLGASSRLKKSMIDENLDLQSLWRSKLTEKEYAAIMNPKSGDKASTGQITAKEAIDKSIDHHFERLSVVPVRKVLAHALKLGYGNLLPEDVKEELKGRENIIYGETRYLEMMTTIENIHAEDKMLEWVTRNKGRLRALNPVYKIKQEFLNEQQRQAVKTILSSQDQLTVLSGGAGTGKSSILSEIRDGIEEAGGRVVAIAPSATASRDVLRSKGFEDADTIAAFLRNNDLQEKSKGQTILVDEASLIGINTILKLQYIAEKQNSRLILSGDTRQLSSPEAGDAMRLIVQKVEPTVASIDIIQRQKANPKYLSAVALIAKGEIRKGFMRLDKMNAVIEIQDQKERHDYIAEQYCTSIAQKRSALIIAPTNQECLKINEQVRTELKARGRVQEVDKRITIQRNLSLTLSQKKDISQYEKGMSIQYFQNVRGGIKAGTRYEVEGKTEDGEVLIKDTQSKKMLSMSLEHAQHFQVYQKDQINLSVGEKIIITQNGRTKQKTRVNNGQQFTIKSFKRNGDIELSSGKVIDKDFGYLDHGYCGTVHKAQGKTCDDVYLAIGSMSLPAVTEKSFYVGASRASKTIQIVTDHKDILKETVTKPGERMSAKELADKQKQKSMWAKRVAYYNYQTEQIIKNERGKQKPEIELHQSYEH